jgi:hypothetical protein
MLMVLFCFSSLLAQSVYVPVHSDVYEFLKRMESRQLLTGYQDAAKPLSRMYLASMLATLKTHEEEMNQVERDTYEFYRVEFSYELSKLAGAAEPKEERWHVYSKEIPRGVVNFDVDYNLWGTASGSDRTWNRSQGLKTYGYLFDNCGFYFNIVDNRERGDQVNYSRLNSQGLSIFGLSALDQDYYNRVKTPDQGVIPTNSRPGWMEYDYTDASFSWQIADFTLSLEKMNNVWGYGRNGTVIFSDHAPSYPQVKMRVPITKNIQFVYFHAELNSNVIDSAASYTTSYTNPTYSTFREVDHTKYLAAHELEITPMEGVDVSIGESVVYSDKGPLLLYMVPIMLFKSGEHYNNDKDNCQMFGSIDVTAIRNIDAYFSLYIDELNTDKLFSGYASHRQIAFTSGVRLYELPIQNSDITVEYTRVNPACYNHKYESCTFTNNGFCLGSWMGQNADDLLLEVGYTPSRALRVTGFGEIYRKGAELAILDQYSTLQGEKPFLFGPLHIERTVGITAKYQVVRDVFVNGRVQLHRIQDELDPSQNRAHQLEFTLGASLGIW